MQLLTNSRLRAARACQRLHHIQYEQCYRPVAVDRALAFGTMMHAALEVWWRALMMGMREEAVLSLSITAITSLDADPYEKAKAEVLMSGYHYRWFDAELQVIGVEVPFETALINPATGRMSHTYRLAGKIDALVKRPDGRVYIVEHKTSSEDITPGSVYWRRLRMDGQVSQYYLGAESLGHEVAGCIYDVIKKQANRPLEVNKQRSAPETPQAFKERLIEALAEKPMDHFQRGEVVRLEEEMKEALTDIWDTAQQLRRSELLAMYPRNPDACFRWGKACSYFPVCSGEASLEDEHLYKKTEVHPELAEATP